MYKIIKNEPI